MKTEKKVYGDYYIGLDVGTNSSAYAVIDKEYNLLKFKGEPMWGVHLFDDASPADERRTFRTSRRRLDRRQQRVNLLMELFAEEIGNVDEKFFIRIRESALFPEDKTLKNDRNNYFNDDEYKDKDYYKQYPTIHHLICDLMESNSPKDIRLVYIACAWLITHRGHFLSEVSKDNLNDILDISSLYDDLITYFSENGYAFPWDKINSSDLGKVMKSKKTIRAKEKDFYCLLSDGKTASKEFREDFPFSEYAIIKLLSGGEIKPKEIFDDENLSDIDKISLGMDDEVFAQRVNEIGDFGDLLVRMKAIYDWAILSDTLAGNQYISQSKKMVYEQHKQDLNSLKYIVKKYIPEKYNECFKSLKTSGNYVSYARNSKDVKAQIKKVSQEDFCKYINKLLSKIQYDEQDTEIFTDITGRLANCSFMPMQVNSDNRVIPHQLYWVELKKILDNAEKHHLFLFEKDSDGISVKDKILKIFEFKLPYYVGPLRKDNSSNAWVVKKDGYDNEKIYPWNFDKIINHDETEQEFIRRMTNTCTYLPEEKVLAKDSLLYSKYTLLNEINNLKVNDEKITVKDKQRIYTELFLKNKKVSLSKIKALLGLVDSDRLTGIDFPVKSSLKPYIDFRNLLNSGQLTESDAEKIIEHSTFMNGSARLRKWIDKEYSCLSYDDRKYISSLKYKDFGRFSEKFLNGIEGIDLETGEIGTIMHFLWETNNNLQQLLSDRFTFRKTIDEINYEFYSGKSYDINKRLDELYVPNGAKRPVIRTLAVLDDIVKATGHAPEKIFVEMARGADENQKKARTKSRYQTLIDIYKKIDDSEVRKMEDMLTALGDRAENLLQKETVYLYFSQLGKCMYSGETINFDELLSEGGNNKKNKYDRDHIWPQSKVKDDSIHNNKVLVKSGINAEKSDKYPLPEDIRNKMFHYWEHLHNCGLINDEKFSRLRRNTPFSADEKWEFINRQLVETRQSTKAIATLLKEKYPDTEIVYVKAGLSSDFRHEFGLVKSRTVNDLHHAKDAYLCAVVGNVYHSKFTKKWFLNANEDYTLNIDKLLGNYVYVDGKPIWNGGADIAKVRKVMQNDHIHLTKYAYRQKGQLFDQMPVKTKEGRLIPRKYGTDENPSPLRDTSKYGGYNKTTATYFVLTRYTTGKKSDVMLMPVELLFVRQFENDGIFAERYAKEIIKETLKLKQNVDSVEFLLDKRPIKINTVFSLDGFNVTINGKSGYKVLLRYLESLSVDRKMEMYIKNLESFDKKVRKNPELKADEKHDKITEDENLALYDMYIEKGQNKFYSKAPALQADILVSGRDEFIKLSPEDQVKCLLCIVTMFKSNRAGGVDLTLINGSKSSAEVKRTMTLSSWKKKYKEVYILDMSPSGLFEKKSVNLMELL